MWDNPLILYLITQLKHHRYRKPIPLDYHLLMLKLYNYDTKFVQAINSANTICDTSKLWTFKSFKTRIGVQNVPELASLRHGWSQYTPSTNKVRTLLCLLMPHTLYSIETVSCLHHSSARSYRKVEYNRYRYSIYFTLVYIDNSSIIYINKKQCMCVYRVCITVSMVWNHAYSIDNNIIISYRVEARSWRFLAQNEMCFFLYLLIMFPVGTITISTL